MGQKKNDPTRTGRRSSCGRSCVQKSQAEETNQPQSVEYPDQRRNAGAGNNLQRVHGQIEKEENRSRSKNSRGDRPKASESIRKDRRSG